LPEDAGAADAAAEQSEEVLKHVNAEDVDSPLKVAAAVAEEVLVQLIA